MAEKKELTGPDLARGISFSKPADGNMLQGHAKGKPILVARRGDGLWFLKTSSSADGNAGAR